MSSTDAASQIQPASLTLLGFSVSNATRAELLAWLEQRVLAGQQTQVVTLNPEMVMAVQEAPRLASLIQQAELVVADGVGLSLAGMLLGRGKLRRHPGIDLALDLVAACARLGWPVYLLGAAAGVAEAAAADLTRKWPGLNICGVRDGYFAEGEAAAVAASIGESGPSLLLAGMGFPRQEEFIAAHRQTLGAAVLIGVGGALDVFAGRQRRAPRWLQRMGLEWAYRVARDTTRFRRLAALPRFVKHVLRQSIGAAN